MPSLIDLPLEMVLTICRELCAHCNPRLRHQPYALAYGPKTHTSSLAALSRTCRALRECAEPLMYHCPVVSHDCIALARSLIRRPDLAFHVKHLYYFGAEWYQRFDSKLNGQDIWLFEEVMSNYVRQGQGDTTNNIRCDWSYRTQWRLRPSLPRDGHYSPEVFLGALIISQAVNVESIHVEPHTPWDFPYPSRALSRLRSLSLVRPATSTTSLNYVASIIRGAPDLKVINGHWISPDLDPAGHSSVQEITLTSSVLTADDMPVLMACFPNLKRFTYMPDRHIPPKDNEVTAKNVYKALCIRADTLQHVTLDVRPCVWEECDMQSLPSMKSLKTLCLNGSDLQLSRPAEEGMLRRWLPRSIETLGIDRPHHSVYQNLLALAASLPEALPNLRKVRLGQAEPQWMALIKRAFDGAAVEVVCAGKQTPILLYV